MSDNSERIVGSVLTMVGFLAAVFGSHGDWLGVIGGALMGFGLYRIGFLKAKLKYREEY